MGGLPVPQIRPIIASHHRPVAVLVAAFVVLTISIALGATLFLADIHRQAVDEVEHNLVGLSTMLADQADRSLQAMEMVQDAIIQEFTDAKVATPATYAAMARREALHVDLKARIAALPQVNAITVIDHTGKLLNFSRYWPIPDVNISDRDYFTALAADPKLRRFIGQPVRNRGDGAWTIYIARKITAPDGTFLGLVLGAVELGYFERLYAQISPSDDAVVSMFRNDGMLLVRHPRREDVVGKVFSTTGAALIAAKNPAGGVLRNVSPIDGLERLIATKALARYPIILSISRTTDVSLAPFRRQAFAVGMAGILLVTCIGSFLLLLLRQARADRRMAGAEERVRGERELRTHYERFGVALDNMIQGLCLFDADQRLVVMNARFVELYDIPDHLRQPGVRAENVRGYLLSLRGTTMGNWDSVATSPDADAQSVSPVIVQTNTHRDISVLRAPVPGGGWVCTHEDVTERRRSEERLRYLATHDVLTRLPNRIQFEDLVAQKLSDCSASGGEFALLCLDLDGFKQVNDMFGHAAGDHVLTDVAARLSDLLGQNCIAARLGGDEFAVLATDLDALKTPAMAAQAVIDALCIPYAEGERQIDIGCSIGIASYPGDGDTYERLLTASDMALVHAKNVGKGGYRFYEPAMDVAARERQQLALDLKAALGTDQFELHYQPQFDVATDEACGFEALLRWTHPVLGPISPVQFIPLAEETGLILPLGEWVLREACRSAVTWAQPLGIAVNLSIAQFRQANLCDFVREVLDETGLLPSRLELEVTESLFLERTARSQEILRDLKALGVRISIDDFGTGYSSLATLQAFPFDKIKIDRSFVGQIGITEKGAAIVRAIISLGNSLNVPVIAEGIETENQLAFLRQHQCAEFQGYLRGKPLPISAYHALTAPREELRVA